MPVNGTVLLDGKPVAGATVMLIPRERGRPALGKTDAQGKFTLSTYTQGDGALPGLHRVTVTLVHEQNGQLNWIVPKKYADYKTSPLAIEITGPKSHVVNIELRSSETPPFPGPP